MEKTTKTIFITMKTIDVITFYIELIFLGTVILTMTLAGLFLYTLFWLLIVPPMFIADVLSTIMSKRR